MFNIFKLIEALVADPSFALFSFFAFGVLTSTPKAAVYVKHHNGAHCPTMFGVEKASQTYKAGAFLQDDDAGRITESASPIDASAVTKRTFGLALVDASGTTGADVPFIWLRGNVILEATLSDATAGTHTLAQADMWKVYPLTKSTNWYLDANAVSDTGGGVVIEFRDPIGTVDGRVYFMLTSTAIGGANAGSGVY